jgi:hypothetical protein
VPIKTNGNFVSEAYRDGQTYFFEAFYSARQWSAEIWDTNGEIRGSITCLPLAHRLDADVLEDAVCDWVHKAIAHDVGILVDRYERSALRQVAPAGGSNGHAAANAATFYVPRSSATELKGAALRQESRMLVERFREVAEQWKVCCERWPQVDRKALPG